MAGPVFFPDRIPENIRANPRRRAECQTYDVLREQLRGPWHVYYSRPWLGLDRDGRDKDGEADFVLAHPEHGLLILEVKGGGISYDAASDQWKTTNDDGTFRIKNPATQATTNKHVLVRMLKDQPGWGRRYINARIGVVFPGCRVPRDLAPNLPRLAIADATEMHRLGAWVEQRLIGPGEASAEEGEGVGDDGLAILDSFFAASFQLERPVAATLLQAEDEMRILTEHQALILQLLGQHRRLAIPGAAGTGKTSLAVEKAKRLARSGRRTLLLCYNRPLAVNLRNQIGQVEHLEVGSFHAFVRKLARKAKLEIPSHDDDIRDIDGAWGKLLVAALERLPTERFDAIVVDEGQDLGEGWLPAIEALLRDPAQGILYIFYDDNQKVHARNSTIEAGIRRSDVQLNRVLRNTRPIAESYRSLLPRAVTIDGPEGPPVEFRETGESVPGSLVDVVRDLIESRHIAPERLAVLFADQATRDRYVPGGTIGRWEVTDAERPAPGRVVCESIRRFKGLESAVVVLVEPASYGDDLELLYVGMSRARTMLIVLDSLQNLRRLRSLLGESAEQ